MKLKFFMDHVKRDLKLVPQYFIESHGSTMVKMADVIRVFERWQAAMDTEDMLVLEAERFEEILTKEGTLTGKEVQEAFELVMLIHMPLVRGHNDVMGFRLKDADYYRLNNKVLGKPLDTGLADYEQKYQAMIEKRKEDAKRKREQMKEDRERGLIV